jgi:hypothetical protein
MLRTLSMALLAFLFSISLEASVIFVFSTADAGFGALPVHEDLESISPKDTPLLSFSNNGIDYVAISPPQNVWVSSPGYTNYGVPLTTSSILTTTGNENFEIRPTFDVRRIGFDVYTINDPGNPYSVPGAANVEVTVATTTELVMLSLSPPAGNLGFLGIVSSDPILSVWWLADQGGVRNTGVDTFACRPRCQSLRRSRLSFSVSLSVSLGLPGLENPELAPGAHAGRVRKPGTPVHRVRERSGVPLAGGGLSANVRLPGDRRELSACLPG